MKKVSIYVLSLNYGGAEKAITNIANIISQFATVSIKCIYKISDNPYYQLDNNIKIEYLTNLKPNRNEFLDAIHSFRLIKAIKEGFKALKILYLKRKVIINSLKNDISDIILTTRKDHNYYLSKYARQGVIKIGQEHNDFANEKDIRKVIKGAKNLDFFLPASEFLTKKYQELLSGYPVKVCYIPHGICEYKIKHNKKEKQIIAVGRLEEVKAFDDLLEAFSIIHHSSPDYKLVIAGDGSMKESLKDQARRLNIYDCVSFKGFLSEADLIKEYEKSELLVSTSRSESFGLVVIEAANIGVPTIAFSSANGFKEIIKNEENGYLIPNRDIKALANKTIELLNDKESLKRISTNAKKSVSKYYNSNIKELWLNLINK